MGTSSGLSMLFRRHAGHWLEPVREVGCSFFDRPVFHRVRHDIGDIWFQRRAERLPIRADEKAKTMLQCPTVLEQQPQHRDRCNRA